TIAGIVDWLGASFAPSPPGFAGGEGRGEGGQDPTRKLEITAGSLAPLTPTLSLRQAGGRGGTPDVVERPLVIAGEPELFGIVSEPAELDRERPTILILNAGAVHHVGPNRLHV